MAKLQDSYILNVYLNNLSALIKLGLEAKSPRLTRSALKEIERETEDFIRNIRASRDYIDNSLLNLVADKQEVKDNEICLVVDDDNTSNLLLSSILENAGYLVDRASDGERALKLLSANKYNYIFLDLSMPGGMSGLDIAVHIRKMNGDQRVTPIIAVTAAISEEIKEECQKKGFNYFIGKPISKAAIMQALRAI